MQERISKTTRLLLGKRYYVWQLSRFLAVSPMIVLRLLSERTSVKEYVAKRIAEVDLPLSGIAMGRVVYVLMRVLKPLKVVETGVASGVSSTYILSALEKNQSGTLYSVELPKQKAHIPKGKDVGWIVPQELHPYWKLFIGDSWEVLPKLLSSLDTIDIFLHDSG